VPDQLASTILCTKLVQRGVSLILASDFEFSEGLFHTLFNRTVENFHRKFILSRAAQKNFGSRIARAAGRSRAVGIFLPFMWNIHVLIRLRRPTSHGISPQSLIKAAAC
jgi:hypothetical protein